MRLNPECIRDILLTVEENSDAYTVKEYDTFGDDALLTKYSPSEFIYHVRQLQEGNYFLSCDLDIQQDKALINDLSPKGHEFCGNIREEFLWNKIKQKASASLPILFEIAKEIAMNHYLN